MSSWEAVSVKRQNGEVSHATRFLKRGGNRNFLYFFKEVEEAYFTEDTHRQMVIPEDYEEMVYVLANDTTDSGVLIHEPSGEQWNVHRHKKSLWTADVEIGSAYEWGEDILGRWEWATAGGNWSDW